MEHIIRRHILKLARNYAKRNDLALTTVSRRFHGTDSFLDDFARGHVSITLRKADELIARFRDSWPQDSDWPELAIEINKIKLR